MRLRRTSPDYREFLKVLTRTARPSHLVNYEHVASPEFIDAWTGEPYSRIPSTDREKWRIFVDFWLDMGFECIPMEIPLNCPLPSEHKGADEVGFASEAKVVIRDRAEYDRYAWPDESAPIDFRPFEIVASMLPDGVKIVGGVCMGPYEWVSMMLGTVGMSFLLDDDPALVEQVFNRIGRLIVSADRQLASMDSVCALRQGDDLGFRTSTFLSPDLIRKLIIPIYRQMTDVAHDAGKPFILHSCGQLSAIYDDLIDVARIDAKHSFEEVILPVEQFQARYGARVTPLGGLDVDMICRGTPDEIRAYTRRKIEACYRPTGHWALGTGNSLTDYMPVGNYRIVLEEGRLAAG